MSKHMVLLTKLYLAFEGYMKQQKRLMTTGGRMCSLMATSLNVVESKPWQCHRQVHSNAVAATSVSAYYRRTVTILLLDEIVSQMDARFGTLQQLPVDGLSLVPAAMVNQPNARAEILKFGDAQHSEFPPGHNLDSFGRKFTPGLRCLLRCLQISFWPRLQKRIALQRRNLFCPSSPVFCI